MARTPRPKAPTQYRLNTPGMKAARTRGANARKNYADNVLAGREPRPAIGSLEGKQLARLASLSSWGKEDPRYQAAFREYWYKKQEEQNGETGEEEEPMEEPEEEEEEE